MIDVTPDIEIPAEETPAASCSYCDRPFQSDRACALHVGEVHDANSTEAEKEAYEEAREAERDELFYFHMKVVVALAAIYFVVVLVYMVALGSGYL